VSTFSDGTNVLLCNGILVVGIYTTKFDLLMLLSAAISEVFGTEDAIFGVIAFDGYIMMGGMHFKIVFI